MQSLITIAEAVRAGKQSARDVLEKCLDAIAEKNGELNAFIMLDAESARKQAEDIDARIARGEDPGKLAGVPIGVKDIENCIGFPTTQGSLLLKDAPNASNDSIHVARLRAAGAVIVGKTNTPEFGMDGATHNKLWGVTRNPWNPELTPGGSSGGSSAAGGLYRHSRPAAGARPYTQGQRLLQLVLSRGGNAQRPRDRTIPRRGEWTRRS
jgi:aspartyl-tRNA(Asn)/glutamyl-tRNA(Gln) amidotransferase subunit A